MGKVRRMVVTHVCTDGRSTKRNDLLENLTDELLLWFYELLLLFSVLITRNQRDEATLVGPRVLALSDLHVTT